nr:hypothetical protein [uncultured Noviherbaspirillum sp.]
MTGNLGTNEQSVIVARKQIEQLKQKYLKRLRTVIEAKQAGGPISIMMLLEVQQEGTAYFNFVENFVGDSGLLGAHANGRWVTGFAEDCYAILDSLINHILFLRSYSNSLSEADAIIELQGTAYANMQRMVVEYLDKKKSQELKKRFIENRLPIYGFDTPAAEDVKPIQRWQLVTGFIIGCVLVSASVGLAVSIPTPTAWQQFIFRGAMAIGVALITSIVPGFINLTAKLNGLAGYFKLVAGGSLAIFVLIWLLNPPIVEEKPVTPLIKNQVREDPSHDVAKP